MDCPAVHHVTEDHHVASSARLPMRARSARLRAIRACGRQAVRHADVLPARRLRRTALLRHRPRHHGLPRAELRRHAPRHQRDAAALVAGRRAVPADRHRARLGRPEERLRRRRRLHRDDEGARQPRLRGAQRHRARLQRVVRQRGQPAPDRRGVQERPHPARRLPLRGDGHRVPRRQARRPGHRQAGDRRRRRVLRRRRLARAGGSEEPHVQRPLLLRRGQPLRVPGSVDQPGRHADEHCGRHADHPVVGPRLLADAQRAHARLHDHESLRRCRQRRRRRLGRRHREAELRGRALRARLDVGQLPDSRAALERPVRRRSDVVVRARKRRRAVHGPGRAAHPRRDCAVPVALQHARGSGRAGAAVHLQRMDGRPLPARRGTAVLQPPARRVPRQPDRPAVRQLRPSARRQR